MAKRSLKPSFPCVQGARGLFLSQIMNFDWCWECLNVLGGHFVPGHHFIWTQIIWEMTTGWGVPQCHHAGTARVSQAEQGQQPESQEQPQGESLGCHTKVLGAIQGTPPRPFWCHKELSLLPAGVGWAPIPTKGCSGWTAGRNQHGESQVDLKNIKMITSSRVTFLFIYRISQLCMTNFAQSHYLEQFV